MPGNLDSFGKTLLRVTIAGGKSVTRRDARIQWQVQQAHLASIQYGTAFLLDRKNEGMIFRRGDTVELIGGPSWASAAQRILVRLIEQEQK